MKIISLGKIDKKFIPIVLGCIFFFFNRLLFTKIETILFDHALIANILGEIANIFAFIPLLVLYFRSGKMKKQKTKEKKIKNKSNTIKEIILSSKWTYIFLTSSFTVIHGLIICYSLLLKSNVWILDILMTSISYYLVFKVKLYKHHYFSLAIIIITGISLDLVFGNLQKDISEHLVLILLRIIREILYSLVQVINKYLIEKLYCSIYEILLCAGSVTLLLFLIVSVFSYYFLDLDNFQEYFDGFNGKEFLVGLAFIIIQLVLNILILLTNKNNTPCHIFIMLVFAQLAYYMDFSTDSVISIILFIFMFFMSLVFNEIIEINICGLSENTKKNIIVRERIDSLTAENILLSRDSLLDEYEKPKTKMDNERFSINSNDENEKRETIKIELKDNYVVEI